VVTCPACGAESSDTQNFCGHCGAALAPAAPAREERKVVTVLFTDLVGFTSTSEALDPEDVRALLLPYYTRLRSVIERHGGTIEKFIGDAVMAIFGAPVAHEDDPERALRAAFAIRDAILELNTEGGPELSIRTGVNTGEALVALGARPSEGEGMVSGDVVNTAARLQTAAPGGGILAGEATYRATRHAIAFRESPPVQAKGKAEPVTAWEAVGARASFGVDVHEPAAGTFVGRERELALLTDALERSRTDETAQLVTLVGVPGIGKSRLVAELFRVVDAAPDIYLWRQGRSLPYGETQSYWALGEIVKAQAGILESDGAEAAAAKLAEAVRAALPDEGDREWVDRHLQPLVGVAAALDATTDRTGEAFSAWRRFLEGLAEQRPLVLVFEDLHWADEKLLDFVDHLADWVTTVPLLVVATARPELLDRRPDWGGGKRNATTVSIAPLSDIETARLLGGLLDQTLLSAEIQAEVLARTAGNPLFAAEYVRMLQDRGFLERTASGWRLARTDDLPLPESVQGIVAARLDALAPAEKELVQDAAVLGKVFWPSALASFGGRDRADLAEPLHALERKEFVRRDRRSAVGGETQYAFLHVLVRDVAYAQIPRALRAEKHTAVARWIEALAADRADDRAGMLAHHYRAALDLTRASGGDGAPLVAPAREALAAASERAEALYAWPAARERAREALELSDPDDPLVPSLTLRSARASLYLGDYDVDAAAASRDRSLELGNVEEAAEAEVMCSELHWYRGEVEAANAAADRAVALLEARPTSPPKAWSVANSARRACLGVDTDRALRLAEEALRMAGELGRTDFTAHALNTRGMARMMTGDETGGIGDLAYSIEIAERENDVVHAITGRNNLMNLLWSIGRLDEAGIQLRRHRETVERHGLATFLAWNDAETTYDAYLRGDYVEMAARAERFLAEHAARAAFQIAPQTNVLAHWCAVTGRVRAAVEHSERGLTGSRELGEPQILSLALLARAHALAAAGRGTDADALIDELLAEQRFFAYAFWLAPLPLLLADRGRGAEVVRPLEAAKQRTRWVDAGIAVGEGRFADAADIYGRIGSRFVEAWARLLAAEAGDVAGLAGVEAYFRTIGAAPFLRRCEALAAASA
jgi:class 3 adenylate cyclase